MSLGTDLTGPALAHDPEPKVREQKLQISDNHAQNKELERDE
jgi:hypothetical protein